MDILPHFARKQHSVKTLCCSAKPKINFKAVTFHPKYKHFQRKTNEGTEVLRQEQEETELAVISMEASIQSVNTLRRQTAREWTKQSYPETYWNENTGSPQCATGFHSWRHCRKKKKGKRNFTM
jgi:hypothetical protein